MIKIMISAGEVSGDIHGAYLVRELKKFLPDAYFFGLGSEKLLAEGVDIKLDISRRGTIGILEALPNVVPIYFSYLKMVALLKKERPAALILIDSQGINLPLAKAAKRLGIKTIYYIAPQEWLWGTPRGVKKVVAAVDFIVAIFKKEYEVYRSAGAHVAYFGHPLLDIAHASLTKEAARTRFIGQTVKGPVVALCPGSRTQEIKGLLPILLQAGELIKKALPDATFLIPAASTNVIKKIFNLIGDFRPRAVVGQTDEVLVASDLAICASGTINLEAAILGVPNIMTYKLSPLTYFIGKHLLKIDRKIKYFSMPNILLDEKVIPELVMNDASPEKIALEALTILNSAARRGKMLAAFAKLQASLGEPGVIAKDAQAIAGFISSACTSSR